MTKDDQIALLRDALEKLLWEANDGYATCPLTREQADTALAATAAPAEPMIDGYPLYSGIPQPEQTAEPAPTAREVDAWIAQQSNAPALTTKLVEWAEEAVEYVNNPAMSPSLEREGRRLLAAQRGKSLN